jgi:sugar phosphate permease
MIQSGRTLAFSVGPLIAGALAYQWAFWVPAASLAVLFVLNLRFVENSPADAGLGELDTGDGSAQEGEGGLSFVLRKVFTSWQMWVIALSSMMIGFVRNGVDDWWAKYFVNVQGAQLMQKREMIPYNVGALLAMIVVIVAILKVKERIDARRDLTPVARFTAFFALVVCVFGIAGASIAAFIARREASVVPTMCYTLASVGMPIAAVFGGLVSGNLSDAVFGTRRAPVICLAFVGMAVSAGTFGAIGGGPLFAAWMLIGVSFFIQSAHSLVGGAASMDFGGRKAVATAAGLFDGAQYLAGAVVGESVGRLIDARGWGVWSWAQVPFAIVGAVLIATLWNARPGKSAHGGASATPVRAAS